MCYPSRETSYDDFLQEMVELLNGHDRSTKSMDDKDWLDVVGHPTIPHTQSLREPPAQVALQPHSERLIGLIHRNAAKRYLEKLQKDRERNQEVLTECVDNLPIVIRQAGYPDKESSTRSTFPETSTHRRHNLLHQENNQQRVKERRVDSEVSMTSKTQRKLPKANESRYNPRQNPQNIYMSATDASDTNGFVQHSGFTGTPGRQKNNLRYKFGKKKAGSDKDHAEPQPFSSFNPKGYGSVHDELKFERRYKKMYDGQKQMHLQKLNFLNGQRITKNNKLPPIAHTLVPPKDNSVGHDNTFAIMSVQCFNHPRELCIPTDESNSHTSSPGRTLSPLPSFTKKCIYNTEEVEHLVKPIPETNKTSLQFRRDKGQPIKVSSNETKIRQSSKSQENDSAFGTLTEDPYHPSSREYGDFTQSGESDNNKYMHIYVNDKRPKHGRTNKSYNVNETTDQELNKDNDHEQSFDISVHVIIKPKDMYSNV